jgi:hypothetical protein
LSSLFAKAKYHLKPIHTSFLKISSEVGERKLSYVRLSQLSLLFIETPLLFAVLLAKTQKEIVALLR